MLKPLSVALFVLAGQALAQIPPAQPTPSVTPSQTPSPVPPGAAPVFGGPPPALGASPVGGLSRCENLIGAERDKCLQADSAAAGGTNPIPATSPTPGTAWPQNTPPTGTVR